MSQPALDPKALLLEELLADAIRRNHQEAFDLRLRQGACVKALAPGREPPLALACYWDRLEMGKALLERGADPNERCLDGTIPLSQCIGGPSPLFELLLHISDLTVRDEHGANAWTWLCQNARNLDAATLRSRMEALRHIAEPSFIDSRGKSCLDLALRSRHPELVEACLDLGLGAQASAQSPVLELYPSWDWEPGGRARLLNKAMDKFPLTPQGAALGVGWCLDFGDAELWVFGLLG